MKSLVLAAAMLAFAGAASAQCVWGDSKEAEAPITKPAPTT